MERSMDLSHLQRLFDASVWARARSLVAGGGVVRRSAAGVRPVVGRVHSDALAFEVTVDIRDDDGAILGSCACGQSPCAHMAAMLISRAVQLDADDPRPSIEGPPSDDESGPAVLHWLAWARAELERRASPKPSTETTHRDEQLAFILEPEASLPELRPGLGRVIARWTWQKPGGSWARGRRVDPLAMGLDTPVGMNARLCWATVIAGEPRSERGRVGEVMLRHDHGEALDALARSGRCHLSRLGGPRLSLGPPRRASLRWQLDQHGQATLGLEIDGAPRAWVVAFEEARYIDLETGACGPLDADRHRPDMAILAAAPALTPRDAEVLDQASVRDTLNALRLPVPTFVDGGEPRVRPRPAAVRMEVETVDGRHGRHPRLCARATVAYDDLSVELCTPWIDRRLEDRVETARGWRRIDRCVDDEHALAHGLLRVGLDRHVDAQRPFCRDLTEPVGDQVARVALELRDAGWDVTIDGVGFDVTAVEGWWADAVERGEGTRFEGWDVTVGVTVQGERLDLLPAVVRFIEAGGMLATSGLEHVLLRLDDGRHVQLPVSRLARLVETLVELCAPRAGERLDEGRLALGRLDARRVDAVLRDVARTDGAVPSSVRRLARALKRFDAPRSVAAPRDLDATLRDYQRDGLAWLQWLRRMGLSGVLADEMGLGKTMQALAHVLVERRGRRLDRPCLVVAPTSVVHNWAREARRFAPTLRTVVVHGPRRSELIGELPRAELVITSYALLARDDWAKDTEWHVAILDEAHAIKNHRTRLAAAARALKARQRLALTGTPVENHLGELWSLMHWVEPGALGDARDFADTFRRPIEKEGDTARLGHLRGRLAPLMLRRSKDEVLDELPPKTEIEVPVEIEGGQRDLYEAVRLTLEPRIRKALAAKGLDGAQVLVLDALLKLRQTCCDPRLLPAEVVGDPVPTGAKLPRLLELLDELRTSGRRTLVFSQFTSMLDLIAARLEERGIGYAMLTGKTRHRAQVVAEFERSDTPVFLLSLKAGGAGLNLTAADAVIHYDPWWNPAAESQASDRAHRIGQRRPVTVFRLVTVGTVEARILEMHARKRALALGLAGHDVARGASLTELDVQRLLAPLDD